MHLYPLAYFNYLLPSYVFIHFLELIFICWSTLDEVCISLPSKLSESGFSSMCIMIGTLI